MGFKDTIVYIKKSIKAQLAIALGVIGLTLVLSATVFFSISNTSSMLRDQERGVNDLAQVARLAYSAPLWTFNTRELKALSHAILAHKTIVAVNVYDGDAFLMGFFKDAKSNAPVSSGIDIYTIDEKQKKVIFSLTNIIEHEGKEIGRFEVFYSRMSIRKEIAQKNIAIAFLFILLSILVLGGVYFVIVRLLLKPVIKLSDVTRSIARDKDYSLCVRSGRHDEIGVLYSNFNNMIEEVYHNENELKKTKSFLANIIESMPSMLVSVDENGYITQWNKAAEDTTGIAASESTGKQIWMYDYFRNYREIYQDIISSNEPVHLYRQRFEDARHSVSYKNVSLFPLISNGIKGVVIRVDDITELERKDEQLRQAQKMELIGNLAGGLAHDFNNVLGGIVGTISLIKYRYAAGKPLTAEELLVHMGTMEQSSKRAADMVQQLLAVSRRKEMMFAAVDLNEVVEHVVGVCESTFDKSVEIRVYQMPEKTMISADLTQMEQVLLNLCVNAYHAMTIMRKHDEHKGGYITILCDRIVSDRHFAATHPGLSEGDYWKLSVRDTGVGMSESVRQRIFDPFFTTKEKGKGTGLGLSMVYNIVKLHHGCIDVYSEEGLGSTFNVYFPVADGQLQEKIKQTEIDIKRGTGVVFVVDDELVMREIAQGMLHECGYDVLLAENGLEAVKVFNKRHQEIALVLLDMVMPKMSGKEAYEEMKKIDPNVNVLLASGFRQDERTEEILKMGVKGFIQKPYTITSLSKAVYEVLNADRSEGK